MIVTHIGGALVGTEGEPHPVLKLIGVFRAVPVMLYFAANNRPVGDERIWPFPSAPRCSVSALSIAGQVVPGFATPPMHCMIIVASDPPPGIIELVRSTFEGLRIV